MATEVLIDKNEWLDNLINICKPLWLDLQQSTFKRYREIGQHIINSGYTKGQWHSKEKIKFIEEMKISQMTFSYMVQLGEMDNKKFKDTVFKFSSLHEWAHQSKPTEEKITETIYIDARYFSNKEEFEQMLKGLEVDYKGLFFKIEIQTSDKEELDRRFDNVKQSKF